MSDAYTNEAVLDETAKIVRSRLSFGTVIARWWGEAVVVAIALLVWLPRMSGPIDLRWDAGVYYVLGTSLATGHGYRMLSEPGSPEALQYPPLLPAVVALYERALGSTDPAVVAPWLRLSYVLLFLAYALAALALARRYLRTSFAIIAVGLSLFQVNTLFLSDLLFTELPFALVSVLFVLVATDGPFASRPWLRETISFLLAAAGFLLRTAGVALLVAWVLESLTRRQWRLAIARGLLALVPVGAWQMYVAQVHGSYAFAHPAYEYQRAPYQFYNVSYAENGLVDPSRVVPGETYAGALLSRLATNSLLMAKRLGEAISTSQGYWGKLLSGAQERAFGRQLIMPRLVLAPILALSMLVVAGIGLLIYLRAWLMVFIMLTSIGLICATPWPGQFQRYLMPLTAFLAIAAVLVLFEAYKVVPAWGRDRVTRAISRSTIAGLIFLAVVLQIYTASDLFLARKRGGASFVPGRGMVGPRFFYVDPLWHGWEQAIAWLQEHSSPDAIVATPYSHLCYLRIGRLAVSPPVESDPVRTRHLLASVPVSYVVVDYGYTLPAVESDSTEWRLVQSFDGTKLYERTAGLK
jgi:hypothetical protein